MIRDTQIDKLKEEIAKGNLATIAGTGVSVAICGNQEIDGFKVATWPGLLLHGVAYLKHIGAETDDVLAALKTNIETGNTDMLILAAEKISQCMVKKRSKGTFFGWLQDTIGTLTVQDPAVAEALVALPGVLATLNYDNLLENVTGRSAVTWLKSHDVQETLRRLVNTEAILHLHGWWKEPDSVVLGLRSYLEVQNNPHAKNVLRLLTIDRTLLFVGCGDTMLDPNFTLLTEWGKEALENVAPRHYLLCRESQVTEFQQKLAHAPWLQPLAYGKDYQDLVPFLRSLVPDGGSGARASASRQAVPKIDLTGYRQAMRKRYDMLKLEALDSTTHDMQPLTLTGMFIAQSARECAEFMPRLFELPKELQLHLRERREMEGDDLDEEQIARYRRAYLDQSPRPVLDIVRDPACQRLVILGDPGSGKSTLLQYLLLDWAGKAEPDLANEPLPLLIELRDYAQLRQKGEVKNFLDYLHAGANVRMHLDQTQLDARLKSNPSCILFFDGLDEVFDLALRKEISTAIHRFADEYPLARIIVTSRLIGYQHQTWRDEGFRPFMLQELDEEQIADFLDHWHRAAYKEAGEGEAKRTLLASAIEHSPAIRQLAGNPLLLTMMAILNRSRELPRDRAGLYEKCAELLLHQWKADAAFVTDSELAQARLDYKDKYDLLQSVARAMQSSERGLAGNLIDEETLERTLADGLKGIPNLRPDRVARALIEQLRGRNFMLCSVGGHFYAFVHRTFLEYFCAAEIRKRFEKEQSLDREQLKTEIFGHWVDETWHEVLSLLAGMLDPKFLREILEWLLAQPDPGNTCHHVFLSARCVGEVRRREELGAVEKHVLERTKALTHFHSYARWSDEAISLSRIRARAVGMVAMVWRQASDTRAWLKALAKSNEDEFVSMSAVQELARGWKNDSDTLPWLKTLAQSNKDKHARGIAVQALARGWKDDPDTLPWLKALAQSDEHWFVRGSVVQELARSWKNDPDTLPLLKALVQSDKDEFVRRSAVEELARGWKNDPDTLPWLKALAQSDEHWSVRQSAVEELARGWKNDPDTLPWLKALAQSDEDADVRQSAVAELARGWKDDPDTLSWLKAHAPKLLVPAQ